MSPRVLASVVLGLLAGCRITPDEHASDTPPRGHPHVTFLGGWAAGDVRHETRRGSREGETDASAVRARLEGRGGESFLGFGLDAFGQTTDDRLFGSQGTEARLFDAFGYLYFNAGGGDVLTMPIRLGGVYQAVDFDEPTGSAASDTRWSSIGGRLEIEPEIRLLYDDEFAWSVFGSAGCGLGAATVEVDGVSGRFDGRSYHVIAEVGTRFEIGHVVLGVSYLDRRIRFDEADAQSGSSSLPGIDHDFAGILVSGGVRF
ncbi:MAG: hypothetical protein KDE27_31005 [Planctomycetes bacterium]|nr:hypothetical protein [Planctomycetota bacterium]